MNDRNTIFKWLIFAGLVVASVVCVTPTSKKVRLGLDLAGGMSFTAQIDQDQLRAEFSNEITNAAAVATLAEGFRKDDPGIGEGELESKIRRELDSQLAGVDSRIDAIMADADDRTVEVIRNRIDGLGVNEPLIVPGKDHRIIIEIPGADEEQREIAESQISSRAKLEFRLVHVRNGELVSALLAVEKAPEGYRIFKDTRSGRTYYAREPGYNALLRDPDYKRRLRNFGNPDPGYSFMLERSRLEDGREVFTPTFVRNRVEMEGDLLSASSFNVNPTDGNYLVNLVFTSEGRAKFAKVTADYCPNGRRNKSERGRQLAIILDDTLYSAPELRTSIPGGRAEITGSFTRDDAALLSNVLKAGSLPAPIKILEKRMIDPSLGRDAIRSGIRASIIGGILVIAFMGVYYCLLGAVADLALALNLVLLPLGALIIAGFFNAVRVTDAAPGAGSGIQLPVLTMPGIAGIVLTIGMAVDANVLIFERIREELRLGKSPVAAVSAGYDRAFLAIFDSNITTLLTGVILFVFGSGPIRGFAITLSAGIVVSMYTALVVTRMVLRFLVTDTTRVIKIRDWFKIPAFDFIGKGRLALTVSAVIIVVTLAIFAIRCKVAPRDVMAIDFTGGTVATYAFEKAPSVEEMTKVLKAGGVSDAVVRLQKSADGVTDAIEVKSGWENVNGVEIGKAITDTLKASFPESGLILKGQESIGSQIGDDLKRDATRAVIFALIGMLVYISLRFEFGFALGAVVALLHDVLITLGLFTLFGRQIGVTAIACFLTIVGYSVNDTIVISDRIREDLKKAPNMGFRELCNRSITSTLGRTMLTSLTTLIAVLSLLVFGGGAIFDFALCMTIGVIAGTYSTIFVAMPVMLAWYKGRRPGMAREQRKVA